MRGPPALSFLVRISPGVGSPRSPAAGRRGGRRALGWLPQAEVASVASSLPCGGAGSRGRLGTWRSTAGGQLCGTRSPRVGRAGAEGMPAPSARPRCLCHQLVACQDLGQMEGRFVGEGRREGAAPPCGCGRVLALAGWWLVAWSRWLRPACSSPRGPLLFPGLAPSPLPSPSHAPAPTLAAGRSRTWPLPPRGCFEHRLCARGSGRMGRGHESWGPTEDRGRDRGQAGGAPPPHCGEPASCAHRTHRERSGRSALSLDGRGHVPRAQQPHAAGGWGISAGGELPFLKVLSEGAGPDGPAWCASIPGEDRAWAE